MASRTNRDRHAADKPMYIREPHTLRPFTRKLREMGFTLDFRDRSGGTTVTQFIKRDEDRELHVQLWANGSHRVTHGSYKVINGHDCLHETTLPSDFTTLEGMKYAILYEWIRPSTPSPVR